MASRQIVHTAAFGEAYRELTSDAVKARVRRAVSSIVTFPDMGVAYPRASLRRRYGDDIRTFPAGSHVIVYRHQGERVVLLTLVPGRLVV